MKPSISVLGAGWLGLPLGEKLVQNGHEVKGSTTHLDKFDTIQSAGIQPFWIQFHDGDIRCPEPGFFDSEILILNVPPSVFGDTPQDLEETVSAFTALLQGGKVRKAILVSSTSVYPNVNRPVFEWESLEPDSDRGRRVKYIEDACKSIDSIQWTILRMGGLVAEDRHPGNFFAGNQAVPGGEQKINLIHRADCIGAITTVIEGNHWGETYQLAAPDHPEKQTFYPAANKSIGKMPSSFQVGIGDGYKVINPQKFMEETGYQFQYPQLSYFLK